MPIIYDYANENDAYGINYVSAYSWKETYTGLLPIEYLDNRIKNISNKVEVTKKYLRNYKGKYIVARDEKKVIGILAFGPSNIEKYPEYGCINALYLLKKYQGLGIGKELFKRAINGLKEMGYSKILVECMTGNKTINFYQKYTGYIVSQIDHAIKDLGNVKADIVLFEDIDEILSLLKTKEI